MYAAHQGRYGQHRRRLGDEHAWGGTGGTAEGAGNSVIVEKEPRPS